MKKALFMLAVSLFSRMLVAQEVDVRALAGKTWYGVYLNEQKMGYAEHNLEIREDKSVSESLHVVLRVNQGGNVQDMTISETRVYAPEGNLQRIVSQVNTAAGNQIFEATVEGDSMRCVSIVGGKKTEEVRNAPGETLNDALSRFRLISGAPSVGDALEYTRFESMLKVVVQGRSKITGIEEKTIEGVTTRVYVVETEEKFPAETLRSISRITQSGILLEDTIGGIYRMRLEPESVAKTMDTTSDVIMFNAALIDKPIEAPTTRQRLVLELEGPLSESHLFSDERQQMTMQNGIVRFVANKVSLDGFTPRTFPITDEEFAQWLKPSPFIQSDDPRIVEKAKEIIGDEKNAFRAASLLCQWVHDNVRKQYSAALSNALDVLDSMEGDCTEHSVLFVALARAAGIPAKEVAGLVYTAPEKKPGFYFHQWATVYVGKWLDMDPMFNQPLPDVTHIKLAEGDLLHQVQLIPIIGKIRVRVFEEETTSERP